MNEQNEMTSGRDALTAAAGAVSPEREGEAAAVTTATAEAAAAENVSAWEGASASSGDEPDNDLSGAPDTPGEAPGTAPSGSEPDDHPAGGEPAPVSGQTAETENTQTAPDEEQPEQAVISDREVEELRAAYPDADAEREMQDPAFRALVTGAVRPTLRQAYELCRREELTEQAVREAVSLAVREAEERLLTQIRVRGLRPVENGTTSAGAVQTHAAVDRLTRAERADLARRAERGDHVRL